MKLIELINRRHIYCYHPHLANEVTISWNYSTKSITLQPNIIKVPKNMLWDLTKYDQILLNSDLESYQQWKLKIIINKLHKIVELEIIEKPNSDKIKLVIVDKQKPIIN
jgi:hypothetical protein